MKKGVFIIVDGLDGSGKGTAVDAYGEWAQKQGLKIFDLREYSKKHHALPEPEELRTYQIILSGEPTYDGIGRAIREEFVKENNREYSAKATAEAFSLDRLVLYTKVILPALEMGKMVIQERGLTTSICYQPIQGNIALKELLKLEGNQFTLKHRPDLLLIVVCPPKTCIQRLQKRLGKQDQAIFEKLDFLKKADKRFRSPWFADIFRKQGSVVGYLDTNDTVEETKKEAIGYINDFLKRL
ncbi:MAG: hypothetical protein WCT08_00390 [Patescibacteria group bacterium]|jgi:dTMP kinase